MIPNKTLLIGLFGTGCMAAAGVGGYVATRTGSATPVVVSAAPSSPVEHQGDGQAATATGVSARETTDGVVVAPPRQGSTSAARAQTVPRVPTTTPRVARLGETPQSSGSNSSGATNAPAPAMLPNAAAPPLATEVAEPPFPAAETAGRRSIRQELVVANDSVIGIRLDAPVSSESAKVEDRVTARVTRDVMVGGVTAIPAGSRLEGTVTAVERGGKIRDRSRIGIRFTSLTLGPSMRFPIQTETIFRDGVAPVGEATSKIGASAVVGTILGAVIGGKKGAAIGGAAGAAGGTAMVMSGDRNEAIFQAGAPLTVRLTSPLSVAVERDE